MRRNRDHATATVAMRMAVASLMDQSASKEFTKMMQALTEE